MALNSFNTNLVKFSIVTVMLQFITNGAAIKCFVCDSSDNPSCADLKSNSSIVAEECTLDKMKSIDTWLFELNKFAYFDTGANKSPLMNCQKVVARDPNSNRMVTARFCQLNTGESDACNILRTKLRLPIDDGQNSQNYNGNNNGRRIVQSESDAEQQFHCSICTEDNCNGASSLQSLVTLIGGGSFLSVLMIMPLGFIPRLRLW